MIVNGIILFLLKKFLLKTNLLGGQQLINDLRFQIRDQQGLIDYQTKKIIELQTMVLRGRT